MLVLTNDKFAPLQYSSFLGLQRFSITLKRRQRAKIKIILALCQQSETLYPMWIEGLLLKRLF
ncbi:hypothetical protein BPUM_2325 [Bacillus pumilus SAFR-032]|uniref:Uncharacterized protein n=1 Tax=Bacillus pumilus (strain SAFR-032) TaxID=315750 RepID=A8FFH4_BACP2|nr:hypothetical protein BPUM_2325 [Bacillus pumilus SAFR-032]